MAKFGQQSKRRLHNCDERLKQVFEEVVLSIDCAVLCGHRNETEQNIAFNRGKSKLKWPKSKHNTMPSMAIDIVPYPIDWEDIDRFHNFAVFAQGVAAGMGYKLRWGGTWSTDPAAPRTKGLFDAPHFEIVEE